MRIVFIGDVVGRSGRAALQQYLPEVIAEHEPDCVVVNGENAAGGFGISEAIAKDFFSLGVDVITTGNHVYDQKSIMEYLSTTQKILRPLNYPEGSPGVGYTIIQVKNNKRVAVINIMGRVFMDALDCPFQAMKKLLKQLVLGEQADAIVVDMHAETTSEKMAMGHFLDGRVSLLVGTHTHVPTADYHIMAHGSAYQSDAGMTGNYDSVIGMDKKVPIQRFVHKLPTERMQPAQGEGTLCGVVVTVDEHSGLALAIQLICKGGVLVNRRHVAAPGNGDK